MSTKIIFHHKHVPVTNSSFEKKSVHIKAELGVQKKSGEVVKIKSQMTPNVLDNLSRAPGSGGEPSPALLGKKAGDVVIDNGSGFIWHFSGLDKYLVKYFVSVGLGNKNSCYNTLDLT